MHLCSSSSCYTDDSSRHAIITMLVVLKIHIKMDPIMRRNASISSNTLITQQWLHRSGRLIYCSNELILICNILYNRCMKLINLCSGSLPSLSHISYLRISFSLLPSGKCKQQTIANKKPTLFSSHCSTVDAIQDTVPVQHHSCFVWWCVSDCLCPFCCTEGCPGLCNGNGRCTLGNNGWFCVCQLGWRGTGCDTSMETACSDVKDNDGGKNESLCYVLFIIIYHICSW